MPLQFLVPALLAGLAALAIPLLVHLRHRNRDRPQPFPSLMFLEQLAIKTERQQRITDWPLLLVRAAALSLLICAFARPWWQGRSALLADARPRAVVLLIDRSQSMQYAGLFPRALDSARAVLSTLRRGDQVAVIAYDDRAELLQRLTSDHAAARAAVERITPLARGTRLADALRLARHALRDLSFASTEVVVISDLSQSSAEGLSTVALPSSTQLRPILVRAPARSDRSVRSIEVQRVRQGSGPQRLVVKVRVRSLGTKSGERIAAALLVNGRVAATSSVQLTAGGDGTTTFPSVAVPDAAIALQVALTPDALPSNDTLYAVAEPDSPIRVTLVASAGGSRDAFHLKRALTVGDVPAFRVDERIGLPPASEAKRSDVLLLWDLAPTAVQLRPWLNAGRGIVLAPGAQLGSGTAGRAIVEGVRFTGSSTHLASTGTTLQTQRFEHPLFRPFRDVPSALETLRAWETPRLDAAPAFDEIATFSDGSPALLEQRIGRAHLLVTALPLDIRRGDAPLQPIFVPFVQQLLRHASGRDETPLWRSTQDQWSLPAGLDRAVVEAPTGRLLRPTTDSVGTRITTPDAGFYRGYTGRVTGAPAALLAVNTPESEAINTPLDTAELKLALSPHVSVGSSADTSAVEDAANPADREAKQGWWRLLLAGAMLLLVGETVMATRGHRAKSRLRTTPSGGARAD